MGQPPSGLEPRSTSYEDIDGLLTEAGGDAAAAYELEATEDLVRAMTEEDASVPDAVGAAAGSVAAVIDAVSERLGRGGRLVYAGAGSSGRIAALDAYECETTFSTPPGKVVALVPGDAGASSPEQEAAEDDRAAGRAAVEALGVGAKDAVVGLSASGRTPFTLGAVEAARRAGALTACVVCVEGSELERKSELPVVVLVGPEFIAGSTRLKAGTAQKLVLNALSTIAMIRLGKTYGNLMVDVAAVNDKLRARVRSIVRTATGASPSDVEVALRAADGDAKVAIVSLLAGVGPTEARARLNGAGNSVRAALER